MKGEGEKSRQKTVLNFKPNHSSDRLKTHKNRAFFTQKILQISNRGGKIFVPYPCLALIDQYNENIQSL